MEEELESNTVETSEPEVEEIKEESEPEDKYDFKAQLVQKDREIDDLKKQLEICRGE